MNPSNQDNTPSAFKAMSPGAGSRPPFSDSYRIPVVSPHTDERGVSAATLTPTAAPLPKVIKLDVGGFKFTSSRATLCSIPNSHLEAMFSGRHSMEELQTEDGTFFIDRDGT